MADKKARAAHRNWLRRRNKIINKAVSLALWVKFPYPGVREIKNCPVTIPLFDDETPYRMCMALAEKEFKYFNEKFVELAAEIPVILAMYNSPPETVPRALWVPLFGADNWRKLVYQLNHSYRGIPNTSKELTYNDEIVLDIDGNSIVNTVKFDAQAFIKEHGWKPENVTIRVSSGSRYEARVWSGFGGKTEVTRIATHCVILPERCLCASHGRVTMPIDGRAVRIDKKMPSATKGSYEFIHYPKGRPSRPTGKK